MNKKMNKKIEAICYRILIYGTAIGTLYIGFMSKIDETKIILSVVGCILLFGGLTIETLFEDINIDE